jgi:hypothetical protein
MNVRYVMWGYVLLIALKDITLCYNLKIGFRIMIIKL